MTRDLDVFGRILMKEVRDLTISSYDRMASGTMKSIMGKKIHALTTPFNEDQKEVIKSIVLTQIDAAIHNFLWLIERKGDSTFPLFLEGGVPPVDLAAASDGLTGELYSDEGWIAQYSVNESSIE